MRSLGELSDDAVISLLTHARFKSLGTVRVVSLRLREVIDPAEFELALMSRCHHDHRSHRASVRGDFAATKLRWTLGS